MKKLLVCMALFVCGIFIACDPVFFIDYSICNKSGHDVTITSTPIKGLKESLWDDNPNGIIAKDGVDTMVYTIEGIGTANLPTAKAKLKLCVYGDTVTFTFDDGKQLFYYKQNDNGVFDVKSSNYSWSSKMDGLISRFGYLKYTITQEDYNNAR